MLSQPRWRYLGDTRGVAFSEPKVRTTLEHDVDDVAVSVNREGLQHLAMYVVC